MHIEYKVSSEQRKSYLFIPFEVPQNVERLEIRYTYKGDNVNSRQTGKEKNVIDFALLDNNGDDIGTRGSEIRHAVISAAYSTSGFKKREPAAGTWTIILGAYQIVSEGVTVIYDIDFQYKKFRWLKGDTHMHTTNSDGVYDYRELCLRAKKAGLDFVMITDHNNTTEGKALPDIDGLTCIRGVELSSYFGHINMWGLAKPYHGSYATNDKKEFLKLNKEARANGAVQSICHPTCSLIPWQFGLENVELDALEVWNGPMRKDNLKAVELWNGLLKDGKKIPMVGGSDYHRDFFIPYLLAKPTTRVYANSQTPEAILDAVKQGRSVVTFSPHSTFLTIETPEQEMIGDTAAYRKGREVIVKAEGLLRGHTVKVIDAQGEYYSYTATRKQNFEARVPVRGKGYVRAEIVYRKKCFAKLLHKVVLHFMLPKEASEPIPPFIYALTNPIYFE
ncbi:MAG: CehA/McbA family metallohydrolase [Clostridia bacterium]|nr:CehA/McbA family metallohydrolase [Clostridia bacterium]